MPGEYNDRLQASYATAMNIWIGRFKTAQGVIRQMEGQIEKVLALHSLHQSSTDPTCKVCLTPWPCGTVRLLLKGEPDAEQEHVGHDHG